MSFNEAKCHKLTVTKKRNKISTGYTLHDQTLDKVTGAKNIGVEITEKLHWGKHNYTSNYNQDQQSERLRLQKAQWMPNTCPCTVLQKLRTTSARIRSSGVISLQATSQIVTGDGETTLSSPHPSALPLVPLHCSHSSNFRTWSPGEHQTSV